MSQSKTNFDSTKIKETVRLMWSKVISNKILAAGLCLAGLIIVAVCLVLIVGNKSPDKEGKKPLYISLCASYNISIVIMLMY